MRIFELTENLELKDITYSQMYQKRQQSIKYYAVIFCSILLLGCLYLDHKNTMILKNNNIDKIK